MRYQAKSNDYLEGWDIIDTESWTSNCEDRENTVVATVWDGSVVEQIIKAIDSLDLPRTIG